MEVAGSPPGKKKKQFKMAWITRLIQILIYLYDGKHKPFRSPAIESGQRFEESGSPIYHIPVSPFLVTPIPPQGIQRSAAFSSQASQEKVGGREAPLEPEGSLFQTIVIEISGQLGVIREHV